MSGLLTIMGSGETSPTMAKVHRQLHAAAGVGGAFLDTPFGFQENADQLTERVLEYFRESVGVAIEAASFRRAADVDPVAYETMLARVRAARYVFAGPGSPSYALRQWEQSAVPGLLRDKLRTGGSVTFASAAALTLGRFTVPVYEIYKVGEDPHWLPGLDLLAEAGLQAAVIPHYNNAEGGNHDTRYCYLGERRLQAMEAMLPDEVFVLGVDEHTGLTLNLASGAATVVGLGVVTVRQGGRSRTFPAGTGMRIEQLGDPDAPGFPPPAHDGPVFLAAEVVVEEEHDFDSALARGDIAAAVAAMLEVDRVAGTDDNGRAMLRSMIVRLGEAAEGIGRFVDAMLALRAEARESGRYADADAVRDRLVALGVEVNDSRESTTWRLLS